MSRTTGGDRCASPVPWRPTHRRPVIEGAVDARLQQIIGEGGCTLIELHTLPDHLHLLVECDPRYAIHRLVTQVQDRSCRLLRDEFPSLTRRLPTWWTNSYVVATLGGAPWEIVQQYVENQPTKQPPFPPYD